MEEKRWVYSCQIFFNGRRINQITITDYYQKKHPNISNELILKLIEETLSNKELVPIPWAGQDKKEVFRWNATYGKKYRLIFWYDNHIRNCYRID